MTSPEAGAERLLVAEAQHRMANAFHIVSAMLARSAREEVDPRARQALQKANAQVRAFALLNEQLRWSDAPEPSACAAAYLKKLATYLAPACLTDLGVGLTVLATEPQHMSERECRHLGLIATELVLNAAKHAFVGRDEGEVRVLLGPGVGGPPVRLIVVDDGVGFASELQMNPRRGLGFVQLLAEAIGAVVDGQSGDFGTAITVTLPSDLTNETR